MNILITGVGHMGSWLASELADFHEIAVYDSDKKKCNRIKKTTPLESLDQTSDFRPELIINAVSLKETRKVFNDLKPYIPPGCMVADIMSIKGDILSFYKKYPEIPFVSIHPMFGPRFAKLNNLNGENVIIISDSCEAGKKFFKEFFSLFKVNISECSFREHDALMAYSLTLPFASSIVFSACVTKTTVPGTTFSRHHQIAEKLLQEDDYLLSEVLFNPDSLAQLERICSKLEFLKHVIKARDYEESEKFFQSLRENLRRN